MLVLSSILLADQKGHTVKLHAEDEAISYKKECTIISLPDADACISLSALVLRQDYTRPINDHLDILEDASKCDQVYATLLESNSCKWEEPRIQPFPVRILHQGVCEVGGAP